MSDEWLHYTNLNIAVMQMQWEKGCEISTVAVIYYKLDRDKNIQNPRNMST